jgi:hypothetical protein
MANRRELLDSWEVPHEQRYGLTLVARKDAAACVRRIIAESCRFYGYDAFTLSPEHKVQPHLDWSASWPAGGIPSLRQILSDLQTHPSAVTHYEFVFEDDD